MEPTPLDLAGGPGRLAAPEAHHDVAGWGPAHRMRIGYRHANRGHLGGAAALQPRGHAAVPGEASGRRRVGRQEGRVEDMMAEVSRLAILLILAIVAIVSATLVMAFVQHGGPSVA